jgi:Ca2+-binding RTX toxin-like protein
MRCQTRTSMQLTADGGPGDNILIGSDGADVLHDDAGDDVLLRIDVFDG